MQKGAEQVGSYLDTSSVVDPTPLINARAQRLILSDWKNYVPLGVGLVVAYAMNKR